MGSSLEHWEIEFVNKIVTPTHGLDVVVVYAMSVNCISYTLPLHMFIQPTRPLAHDIITYIARKTTSCWRTRR